LEGKWDASRREVDSKGTEESIDASADAHRAIVQRPFDEVWGQENLAVIDEVFAPEYIYYSAPPGVPNRGPDNHSQLVEMLRSTFLDITNTLEEIIVEGDTVAFRNTLQGTNQGPFMAWSLLIGRSCKLRCTLSTSQRTTTRWWSIGGRATTLA
jgi:hypothetical protein